MRWHYGVQLTKAGVVQGAVNRHESSHTRGCEAAAEGPDRGQHAAAAGGAAHDAGGWWDLLLVLVNSCRYGVSS